MKLMRNMTTFPIHDTSSQLISGKKVSCFRRNWQLHGIVDRYSMIAWQGGAQSMSSLGVSGFQRGLLVQIFFLISLFLLRKPLFFFPGAGEDH